MKAVAEMEESYLWVDSLCIPQDDEVRKHHLLQEMAWIYNRALITLVALHGDNAESGLPGVRPNTRRYDSLGSDCGLEITTRGAFSDSLGTSTYNSRAWTFQERLLSRRCLYFTGPQAYLCCNRCTWQEDRSESHEPLRSDGDGRHLQTLLSTRARSESWAASLKRYARMVESYAPKRLTFPWDALDAFAGVARVFEEHCGWTMLCGLPEAFLEHTLLWEQKTTTTRRLFTATETANSVELFPSWSWAAWTGGIKYDPWDFSNLRLLHSPFYISESSTFRLVELSPVSESRTWVKLSELDHSIDPRSAKGILQKHHLPADAPSKANVLYFSAAVVPTSAFSFQNIASSSNASDPHVLMMDAQRRCCGIIPGVASTFPHQHGPAELDVVLLAACKMSMHSLLSLADAGHPTFYESGFPNHEWAVLTVLFVKWEDGYAYRVALGYVHKDPWQEAGPRQKQIRLA